MENPILSQNLNFISEGCECEDTEYTYANQEAWKTYEGYYSPYKTPINIITNKIHTKKLKFEIKYTKNSSFKVIKN